MAPHLAVDHSELQDKKLVVFNSHIDPQTMQVTFVSGLRGAYTISDPKYSAAGRAAKRKVTNPAVRTSSRRGQN